MPSRMRNDTPLLSSFQEQQNALESTMRRANVADTKMVYNGTVMTGEQLLSLRGYLVLKCWQEV